jgi:hypothetical protein
VRQPGVRDLWFPGGGIVSSFITEKWHKSE